LGAAGQTQFRRQQQQRCRGVADAAVSAGETLRACTPEPMSRFATKLHVPSKDPVFKHKQHLDLGRCIEAWLAARYGAELAQRKRGVLQQLQQLRTEALRAIGTGGRVASDDASIRKIFAYYHCLSSLELPFGEDEAQGLLRVRFEWSSAYSSGQRTKSYTPLLERVAVLFDAACAMSAHACEQSDAIKGPGTAEEWKSQCHTFRAAAGVFKHIKEEFYLPEGVTEDLTAPGLDALTALMVAQAQECFLEQAANQGLSLPVRAKIASGTAQCYGEARTAASHASLTQLQRVVLPWVTLHALWFGNEAQLLAAKQTLEADDFAGDGIGLAIQRLRWMVAQRPSVQGALSAWTKLAGDAKAARLGRIAAQDAEVDRLLAQAEEDNESIYLDVVPAAPPPALEAKVFVSPLHIEENSAYLASSPSVENALDDQFIRNPKDLELVRAVSRLSRPLELEAECARAERGHTETLASAAAAGLPAEAQAQAQCPVLFLESAGPPDRAAIGRAAEGAGVSVGRLAVLLLAGRLGPNTRVWREGFGGGRDEGESWRSIGRLLGVQPRWFTEADAERREGVDPVAFAWSLEQVLLAQADAELARAARNAKRMVKLHVYHASLTGFVQGLNLVLPKKVMGGVYHAGVEVDGNEWSYGYTDNDASGVSPCVPALNEWHKYYKCKELGPTPLSEAEVAHVIQDMLPKWQGRDYNLISHNCCHFSEELCRRLRVAEPVPTWVNKMARAGERLGLG
jgi:hypothetical protein